MKVIHMSLGGPIKKIRVGKKVYYYEQHPHLGPMPCFRNGEPRKSDPGMAFWKAVSKRQQDELD